MRRLRLLPLVLIALLLAGCGTAPKRPLIVAGETLYEVGRQFVKTASLYDRLFDTGKITKAEYRDFAEFARQFQVAYPIAVDTYLNATTDEEAKGVLQTIIDLKAHLIQYVLFASEKGG